MRKRISRTTINPSTSPNKTNFLKNKKFEKRNNDPFAGKIEHAVRNFTPPVEQKSPDEETRLNKFISNAGVCSRRQADEYIKAGYVTVHDVPVMEMGYKVLP